MKRQNVVSVIITFITSRCFVQHQHHGDMEMTTKATKKIAEYVQKQKQVKTTYSQKLHKYQIHFKN